MKTIFMQSKNSKTSEAHRFRFNLTNKLNLKYAKNNLALANLSIYYTWKNINSEYNKNEFKKSTPTWSDKFDSPDGSYYIPEIQDCLEFIIKKHETSNLT